MTALRLMTFNVHLPSTALAIAQGIKDTAVEDAKTIAKVIQNLPIRERPDVIAFNEVFHETARDTLITRLGKWPHVIKKLDNGLLPPEDSGLLLLSKFPFVPLPTGNNHEFEVFAADADTDQGAAKGVAMVRIETPIAPTTIVFTHMQASYDADNSEHDDVRRKQFDQIVGFLKAKLGQATAEWQNVVLVGDLNVKGDPNATTSEWNRIFEPPGEHEFGTLFADGWREGMHPPTTLTERDPGFTNNNPDTVTLNRLDYQCFKRIDPATRGIVAHHLATPLRELSDHWSLLGRLQLFTKACTPATAVDVLALTPVTLPTGQSQSELRIVELNVGQLGGYQWGYVGKPGTYSLFLPPDFELAVFSEDDLTHPLASIGTIAIAELSAALQAHLQEQGMVPKGAVHVSRKPFFVRVRSSTESGTGSCPLAILQHRGESPATAIILTPHLVVDPQLPSGQKLGADDKCWFRADISKKFDELAYTSTFMLRNPEQKIAQVILRDAATKPITPQIISPSAAEQIPTLATATSGTFFLTLARNSITDTKFTMEWQSPLTFLRLKEAISLRVDDETGSDWPGEDELELGLALDNEPLLSDAWDNADAGEDWPDLPKKIRDTVTAKLNALVSDIAFDTAISVEVLKTDGIAAHGSAVEFIDPLKPSDNETEVRKAFITVTDPLGDGKLSFSCTISKFPSGQA
jgi:endonuclease/exonuclease/phosphatase family metal-dependent hydrolase